MKRRYDALLPFEEQILAALGDREMYGLEIAALLGLDRGAGGFSTLYRALRRLADPRKIGILTTRLEPSRDAERAKRPRRRFYRRATASAGGSEEEPHAAHDR